MASVRPFAISALAGVIVSAIGVVPAAAQLTSLADDQETPERRGAIYLRAGAGVSFLNDWDQDLVYNPDLVFITPPPSAQTIEFGTGFTAAAAIGFDYFDGVRTELEYRYARAPIDLATEIGGPAPRAPFDPDADVTGNFVFTNVYYDFDYGGALIPFIGIGVGGAFVDNELADEKDAALAYQGRAGVALGLGETLSADLEYVYLRTNNLEFGPGDDDFSTTGGDVRAEDAPWVSSHIMLSLRKTF